MRRFFRSVAWREDPLRLLARIPNFLYSKWVAATYPFASIGHGVQFHYTWDSRRYVAHRVKLGNSIFIGKDVHFGPYCLNEEEGEPLIIIGDRCGIHRQTQISAKNKIDIADDVIMGPAALIMDHNHAYEDTTRPIIEQGVTAGGTIRIEQGCWIGRGAAIICDKGELVLGRNCVVAANALVTRSFPPYSVIVGNPARVVRQFDPAKGIWVGAAGRSPAPESAERERVD